MRGVIRGVGQPATGPRQKKNNLPGTPVYGQDKKNNRGGGDSGRVVTKISKIVSRIFNNLRDFYKKQQKS
jgi:hypothetical protein